jgi:hypothetical protein
MVAGNLFSYMVGILRKKEAEMKKHIITAVIIALLVTLIIPTACAKPAPAEFELSSLSISPAEVVSGEPATVTADVGNVGEVQGTYTTSLIVNDTEVETKQVLVSPGVTEPISFTMTEETPGTYTVRLGALSGTLKVIPLQAPSAPPEVIMEIPPPTEATSVPPKVVIRWSAIKGATGYECQLATSPQFRPWSLVIDATGASALGNVTSFEAEVLYNTTYHWRVRSYNAVSVSSWSARTSISIPPPPTK